MLKSPPPARSHRPGTTAGRLAVFGSFVVFLMSGLVLHRNYGVGWDEPMHRTAGAKVWDYVFRGDQTYQKTGMRIYGQVLEIPLAGLERALGLTDKPREAYLMRHLAGFLLFYAGIVFFFLLCRKRFGDWRYGLLGALMLALSPRIFGDSFHNLKDIGTLVFYVISFFTLLRLLEEPGWVRTILHALACAVLIGVRIVGIAVPLITIALLLVELFVPPRRVAPTEAPPRNRKRNILISAALFVVLGAGLTVLLWPTLWSDPLRTFAYVFRRMAQYSWPHTSLYFGEQIKATRTPWHYTPVWIAITTPVAYTLLFAVGLVTTLVRMVRRPVRFYRARRSDLAFVAWFLVPLIAVAVLRSRLYDGWRHMFFVYPALVLLALVGLEFLLRRAAAAKRWRKAILALVFAVPAAGMLEAAVFMVLHHPHENVFFNAVVASDMKWVKRNFELDYWGLSYRQGLEYIVRTDTASRIRFHLGRGGLSALEILPPEDRARLEFVPAWDSPDYFLGNYRWHTGEYDYNNEAFSVRVYGEKIMVVYDLRPRNPGAIRRSVRRITEALEKGPPVKPAAAVIPQVCVGDSALGALLDRMGLRRLTYREFYRLAAKPDSVQGYLPALAFWPFEQEFKLPEPFSFMEDAEHFVSAGYAFTFLGADERGAVGAYIITPETELPALPRTQTDPQDR